MKDYLLWDFDGTLARRQGMWTGAVLDAALHRVPHKQISADEIRPHLSSGFPWHKPEEEHYHLGSGSAWWKQLEPVFAHALTSAGVEPLIAAEIAQSVRAQYLRPDAWQLLDGAADVLSELAKSGWSHLLISNHVPELEDLVKELGIHPQFDQIFSSANLGVEKPNALFCLLAEPSGLPPARVIDRIAA